MTTFPEENKETALEL